MPPSEAFPALLRALCPPVGPASARLDRLLAQICGRRLRRARRTLASPGLTRAVPGAAGLIGQVESTLRSLTPAIRQRLLTGPDLRGYLSEVELWAAVHRLARSGDVNPLFDCVSRTDQLVRLLPFGRLDAGFAARSARFATARLRAAQCDLAACLLGARLAYAPAPAAVAVRLRPREEPEQGRPAGRIDLGTFGGAAGPLAIAAAERGRTGAPMVTARLRDGVLELRREGAPVRFVPAAGSPFHFRSSLDRRHGARPGPDPGGGLLLRRRLVPGTTILLAPALRSSPRRLRVGRDLPGLDRRLERALRLVHLAWPEAHAQILARTAMIVPVREPGLVSYSLAARPGVSFVNVHGKTSLKLADDLLHETAHHLLHGIQEAFNLMHRGPETEEVQAFNSPWRGSRRPLHGILHGTYTFLFRAELFTRLAAAQARLPRALGPLLGPGGLSFLRRERRRELSMIRSALVDLQGAATAGLLTPAGRTLLRAMSAWRARLERR
jgi:HEXXH motif-containing protein